MSGGPQIMIRAVIRPEREAEVLGRLEAEGFYAMTKAPVLGRGEQRGIQVGAVSYDELAKLMLMVVVDETDLPRAVRAIEESGRTGHHGDGKIFVQTVRESYTIRSGTRD
jgi:nitrogen regulatory protein PII 1